MLDAELNIIFHIYIGGLLAAMPAYLLALFANFLDDAMDYGGYFWKLRAYLARRAIRNTDSIGEEVFDEGLQSAYNEDETETQINIVAGMYDQIASKNYLFKRWICKVCMAVYFSIYVTILGAVIMFLLGFHPLCIIAFSMSLSMLTYRFV